MLSERKLTSFRLSLSVLELISKYASAKGVSRAAIIEFAVRDWVRAEEQEIIGLAKRKELKHHE